MRHYKRVREIYATGENLLIPGPECRVERSLLKPHRAVAPRRMTAEQIKAGWLHYVTYHCAAVVTSTSSSRAKVYFPGETCFTLANYVLPFAIRFAGFITALLVGRSLYMRTNKVDIRPYLTLVY